MHYSRTFFHTQSHGHWCYIFHGVVSNTHFPWLIDGSYLPQSVFTTSLSIHCSPCVPIIILNTYCFQATVMIGSLLLMSFSQEHKNCGEMNEIEAKVKYVKLARSLRTYGVSFFLVKVSWEG